MPGTKDTNGAKQTIPTLAKLTALCWLGVNWEKAAQHLCQHGNKGAELFKCGQQALLIPVFWTSTGKVAQETCHAIKPKKHHCPPTVQGTYSHFCHTQHFKERQKVKSLSRVWLLETPKTVAHQVSPFMEFSRQEYWSGLLPFPSPGDLPDSDQTWVSRTAGRRFTVWATREALIQHFTYRLFLQFIKKKTHINPSILSSS